MSETLTGQVQSVELTGPLTVQKEGRNKGKQFHIHTLRVNGISLIQYDFREHPEAPASIGDNVHIIFSATGNGKTQSNTISKISLTNETFTVSSTPIVNTLKSVLAGKSIPTTAELMSKETKSNLMSKDVNISKYREFSTTGSSPVSKDTSMEVSGLLQALINSGVKDNLEGALREALKLKRKIALELETNGTV